MAAAGWSEPEIMCKKHPDQRQQPGICSSCLREKLAKLPTFTLTMVPSKFSSSLPSSSSCSSSSSSTFIMSPSNKNIIKNGSDSGSNGFGHLINGKNNNIGLMRKSRSITYYVARRGEKIGGNGDGKMKKNKKEGFWSKLMRSSSVKTKGVFVDSNKTAKETSFEHY